MEIKIDKSLYSMRTERNGNDAEITMYGEIVERRPVDFWTDEPIEGDFIILKEFLDDLDQLKKAENITIHLNSVGGDVNSSLAIHNRLCGLSANITVIVDAVAMSGGSVIMCAGDTIKVNPGSVIMIHDCWTYVWDAFNSTKLQKMANELSVIDRSIAEIYSTRFAKPLDDILKLMDEETYMTGREAVEMGFADELIETEEDPDIAVSSNRKFMKVNGHTLRACAMGKLPEKIKVVDAIQLPLNSGDKSIQPVDSGNERRNPNMTYDEWVAANPDEAQARAAAERESAQNAVNDAVNAERQRLSDIDAIASQFDSETVAAAKYGESACTAQEMAYRAIVAATKTGRKFMNDAIEDSKETEGIVPDGSAPEDKEDKSMTNDDLMAAGAAAVRKLFGKKEA